MIKQISVGFFIMLKGMVGIFAVSIFLIFAILIVNAVTTEHKPKDT